MPSVVDDAHRGREQIEIVRGGSERANDGASPACTGIRANDRESLTEVSRLLDGLTLEDSPRWRSYGASRCRSESRTRRDQGRWRDPGGGFRAARSCPGVARSSVRSVEAVNSELRIEAAPRLGDHWGRTVAAAGPIGVPALDLLPALSRAQRS